MATASAATEEEEEEEVTLICIDDSLRMFDYDNPIYKHQLNAIQFYCETKLECNPKNLVGLLSMTTRRCPYPTSLSPTCPYPTSLSPTSDLQKIRRTLKDIICWGDLGFTSALENACFSYPDSPPNMRKRLLMFVGGPSGLLITYAKRYGTLLKEKGVAVDVVNFWVGTPPLVFRSKHWCARNNLEILITNANHNDNSHLVDVEDASSFCRILSDSILKQDLLYLEKKAQDNVNVVVKQESRIDKKIKADDHLLEWFNREKRTSLVQARKNVNVVQQESEPSCNEKNKAVAHHKYAEPLEIQLAKLKIEPFHNDKNTSSADDHAPGIKQNPTKKTSRKKKPRKNVNAISF